MRRVQYHILTQILEKIPVPDYIYGFEKNKSIPVMAKKHVGKDVVVSLDIKDFFPSIKQVHVHEMYTRAGCDNASARTLSELCTYKFYVPQGSLTAPKISNIIAGGTFGPPIEEYCKANDMELTVYADDITVSYNYGAAERYDATALRTMSPEQAIEYKRVVMQARRERARALVQFITTTVQSYGFRINTDKTKVMRRKNRLWVCGVVVNDKVNMRKTERLRLRAIAHNCRKNGVEVEAGKAGMGVEGFIRKYAGRINWLCQLNPDYGIPLKTSFRKASLPYLKKFPDLVIPELAWNSGIEMPLDAEAETKKWLHLTA